MQILSPPPLPIRRSCDIYYRHLAAKGRGLPMWEPEPSNTLPKVYRRRGIRSIDYLCLRASGLEILSRTLYERGLIVDAG
jgi:hypothetical protein